MQNAHANENRDQCISSINTHSFTGELKNCIMLVLTFVVMADRETPVGHTQERQEVSLSPQKAQTRELMNATVNKPLRALLEERLDGIAQVHVIETGNRGCETLRIDVIDFKRWSSRETAQTIVPIIAPVLRQFYEDSPEHPFDMQRDVIDDPDGSDYALCGQLLDRKSVV